MAIRVSLIGILHSWPTVCFAKIYDGLVAVTALRALRHVSRLEARTDLSITRDAEVDNSVAAQIG